MKCKITIDMSNAAFEADPGEELARILRGAAQMLTDYTEGRHGREFTRSLWDINGNIVGKVELK